MPWTAADAHGHTAKADTPHLQAAWAAAANNALASCQKKGGSDCDAHAIRIANAAVDHMMQHAARVHAELLRSQEDVSAKAPSWHRAFHPENVTDVAGDEAVVGRVRGIALVYGVLDEHRTTFDRGCLEKTQERVRAGKVKLYWDHGDAGKHGVYDTDLHIGIVRSLEDVQLPDGRWAAVMEADILNTPIGREKHDYLKKVSRAGGEAGLSIGMLAPPRGVPMTWPDDKKPAFRITECGLREISVTGEPSVPGTTVLQVRQNAEEPPAERELGAALLASLLEVLPEDLVREQMAARFPADERDTAPRGAVDHADEAQGGQIASMAERQAAVRQSFAHEAYSHGPPAQGAGRR